MATRTSDGQLPDPRNKAALRILKTQDKDAYLGFRAWSTSCRPSSMQAISHVLRLVGEQSSKTAN